MLPAGLLAATIIKNGNSDRNTENIKQNMNTKLSWLRRAGIAEGISFLVLMGIAMPLKYFFQQPMAVSIVGWVHGILFVAFIFLAWEFKTDRNKNMKWFATAFVAALLPAGTFFFDKKIKQEEKNN
jgi:integral membrane protein